VSGALLNGGNVGNTLKITVIGGVIGVAAGFLSFAAGSVSSTSVGAVFERAAKHAFVDVWMGGVRNAVYGGELSPIRDAIGGALSSAGNGYINENMYGIVLKVVSSAVLGGTIAEIGGGKFANGAVTGAYSILFNELMHHVLFKNKEKIYKYMIIKYLSNKHEVGAVELEDKSITYI